MSINQARFHYNKSKYLYSPTLWQAMYPTQWARGNWSFDYSSPDLDRDLKSVESSTESLISSSSANEESNSDSASDRRGTTSQNWICICSLVILNAKNIYNCTRFRKVNCF